MYLRKISALAGAALMLAALTSCTAQPQPKPTKASASCFPGLPKVASTAKAGTDLTVTGPGSDSGCLVKLTQKDRQVSLTLSGSKDEILASTSVKATATGKYVAKLHIPSAYSGKASVRLDSGFRFECKDTGSCAAPIKALTVTPAR